MIQQLIGLDFETYGAVSLPDHGLERYVSDKSFTPLIACTSSPRSNGSTRQAQYNFVHEYNLARADLIEDLAGKTIVAHNAGFERRVLQHLGIDLPADRFIDSAVVARAGGAGGKLEAAAPQLLDVDKLEDGWRLIKLFSIPSKEQLEDGDIHFDPNLITQNPSDWLTFFRYCHLDAQLSLRLAMAGLAEDTGWIDERELSYQAVTMEMNQRGWHVDVAKVEEMQRRYLENQEVALAEFHERYTEPVADEDGEPTRLNLNSLKQLKEWCEKRGIRASSFDEKAVAKLKARIEKKIFSRSLLLNKEQDYHQVLDLLNTKQILGGSSLKKLQVILDTVGEDGRLRDQYLHIGAPQTWRTTGRSVQMQNLKRLAQPADMDSLDDPDSEWDNDTLAENIRQVFTASDPNGAIIVGDFSSVESRGLAWLANEHWKLDAYRDGKDLYKVLAEGIYSVKYDQVTKVQRQTGKVGELSCGYQAGAGAVQSFAAGMGVEFTEAEAAKLVSDWRAANPRIVNFWYLLNDGLHLALQSGRATMPVGLDFKLEITWDVTPESLLKQHPGAKTLRVTLFDEQGVEFVTRFFHGCYLRGTSICYYKPSQLKNGDLWSNHYTDPKTKQVRFYSIYGGKLAGILTQSFCRELFFQCLLKVHNWVSTSTTVDLVGQFHDEIVLDWRPGVISLEATKQALEIYMVDTGRVRGFPMGAEIKHDYRYTK